MKKGILLFLMVQAVVFTACAQQKKVVNRETTQWRYEIQAAVGQGQAGTALVRIYTYSKKAQLAESQAGKNAVHGVLFKGYPGRYEGNIRIVGRDAMIADVEAERKDSAYFVQFFKDGGAFQRYVSYINNGTPDEVLRVGKEYKIGVTVVVMVDQLRKRLEDDGILKPMDELLNAKKPTIMVVPSDQWCTQKKYVQTYDNQGKTMYLPDYEKALATDKDLSLAIAKINELFAERGFPVKVLEASLKSLQSQSAEDMLLQSKSGAEVAESPIDQLKKTAKADIWVEVGWSENSLKGGSQTSLSFTLQGLDAYTDKQVAGASGTGMAVDASTAQLPLQLESAIVGYFEPFCKQLISHFDNIQRNGREIIVRIKAWDDFEDGLEAEYDGDELSEIIEDWMAANTVNGKFNTTDATENMMLFEQVRIPLQNAKGRDLDARTWLRDLQKMLSQKYGIESKLMTQGLGQAQLVIGGK